MRYSKIAARLGLAVALATGLAACSHEYNGPYAGHSAAWYTKHINKSQKQMQWCQNITREGKRSLPQPTCKDAKKAYLAWYIKNSAPNMNSLL